MLSYCIYWVTKEHKQNPNRLQETRSPFPICWMCWDCTGAAALHSWEHFAGGLRLLTLGSCLPHSCPHGSVVIKAENYAQKCFFGGYLLKISNINNIYSHYNVPLGTSALSSFPKLPRNAIKIWQWQWRSTLVPCLVLMALGERSGAPPTCFVMTEIHWQQWNSSFFALSQNSLKFTPEANFPLSVVGSPLRSFVDCFEELLEAENSIPQCQMGCYQQSFSLFPHKIKYILKFCWPLCRFQQILEGWPL